MRMCDREGYEPGFKTNDKKSTLCFQNGIRSATAFIKRNGGEPVKGHCSQGWHYVSGFFKTPKGNLAYFMTGDDRTVFPGQLLSHPVFRTANHLKDYSGGRNHFLRDESEFKKFMADIDEGRISYADRI